MKNKLHFIVVGILLLSSCNSKKNDVQNTDIDVARAFVKNVLTDDLKEADKFLLKDKSNEECFGIIESKYKKLSKEQLDGYKNADIVINEISNVSDSITVINYSNTYKNEPTKVKIVKVNGQWLVDLKYTFSGNL